MCVKVAEACPASRTDILWVAHPFRRHAPGHYMVPMLRRPRADAFFADAAPVVGRVQHQGGHDALEPHIAPGRHLAPHPDRIPWSPRPCLEPFLRQQPVQMLRGRTVTLARFYGRGDRAAAFGRCGPQSGAGHGFLSVSRRTCSWNSAAAIWQHMVDTWNGSAPLASFGSQLNKKSPHSQKYGLFVVRNRTRCVVPGFWRLSISKWPGWSMTGIAIRDKISLSFVDAFMPVMGRGVP